MHYFQYWYFLNKVFRCQPTVCNCKQLSHDLLMVAIDSIAILNIYGINDCCIIVGIYKNESINLWKKL